MVIVIVDGATITAAIYPLATAVAISIVIITVVIITTVITTMMATVIMVKRWDTRQLKQEWTPHLFRRYQ
jgi:hypothetical protein